MRKPKIPLAYSYLRFSSPQQATGDSIRRQTEAREKWLAEHPGIELDKSLVLTDAGRSAFECQDRATYALARVVDHIKSGRVEPGSYLLVENLDRLSREDAGTATELFLTIVNHGVIVVQLLPMVMEFKKPVNRQALMFAIVELSRGNSESAARSERVGAAWARRIKEARSRVVTRRLPNWIDHHDGKLTLNPEKAKIVRRVFDLALNGDGVTAIARKLNAQHGPRGAPRPHEARPGSPGGRGGRGGNRRGSRDGGGLKLTACCSASPLPSSDAARPVGSPEARPDRVARPLDRGGPGSFAAGRMGGVSGECGIGRGVRARTEAVAIVTRRASAQFLRLVHFVQLDRQRRCYTILKRWSYPTFPRQKIGSIDATFALEGSGPWRPRAGRSNGNLGAVRSNPARETHSMSTAPPAIRDLARRLIALEAARDESPGAPVGGAVRVCDRLRVSLAKLAGVAGFRSLLSRALALAKAEVPSLAPAEVRADGSLEGLDGTGHDPGASAGGEAGIAVVAQLLGLLVTFIGAPLTQHIVRDAWPDAESGEKS